MMTQSNPRHIMAVDIVKGKIYSCLSLKPPKGKEKVESENIIEYSFDISKAN